MKLHFFFAAASAALASASWTKNLNFRSPSEHHPGLGIAINKVVKRNDPTAPWNPAQLNFTHGVASGDPYPTSVILWTRAAPMQDNDKSNITVSGFVPLFSHETEQYVSVSKAPVCVQYKVSEDRNFEDIVDEGEVYTSSDIDYTIKVLTVARTRWETCADLLYVQVEAQNLKPYTTYHYQFNICNSNITSVVGRTKTTPHKEDHITEVSLAVYSCANYREF